VHFEIEKVGVKVEVIEVFLVAGYWNIDCIITKLKDNQASE